jgi:hypothetical protein
LGRSRGGWTTKLHLACAQGRKVLTVVVIGGQRGNNPQFTTVLQRIHVPVSTAAGSVLDRTGC